MAESSKSSPLSPFRECKRCKSICGPEVDRCPKCSRSDFDDLTVKELKAAADANGKIKAFCARIPDWPFEGAWQKKEEPEKPP